MQDGYYFATSPWLIGEQPVSITGQDGAATAVDHPGLRRGQVVQISAADDASPDTPVPVAQAPVLALPVEPSPEHLAPVILRASDRLEPQKRSPEPVFETEPEQQTDILSAVLADFLQQQQNVLARIEQGNHELVAGLEDRLVSALAALLELAPAQAMPTERLDAALAQLDRDKAGQAAALVDFAKAFDRLADKVGAAPRQNDQLLREVVDIRAGLTELRVQARMIELQLFALNRGTDNPLARPLGADQLGAKLPELLTI